MTINLTMSIPTATSKDPRFPPVAVEYPPFGCPSPYAEPLWYSRNVSPHYTDSHRKLRGAVRKYVDEEILPNAFEWESAGRVPDSARDHALLPQYAAANISTRHSSATANSDMLDYPQVSRIYRCQEASHLMNGTLGTH